MVPLPVDSLIPDLVRVFRSERSAVVIAPPGSGKSTRIPPGLLFSGLLPGETPAIAMLQPRRVAARAVAERIADEQKWTLGLEVGYQVRFERKTSAATKLRVMTEGILTRQLLHDPFLDRVGGVILDEFHERSLHSDLALAWLREIQQTVRPDLRLLVMSATLDAGPVAEFLGGCSILHVEASTYPVAMSYLPSVGTRVPVAVQAAQAVERVLNPEGATNPSRSNVLVFLPGAAEIRSAARLLAPVSGRLGVDILPLHGSLPQAEQDRALAVSGVRKVILATNIAETSLTIDGVNTVIDTGLARFSVLDADRGIERLELGKISRASADQRAGRAGRQGPGRCVRLWSEREHQRRPTFEIPEICRVDLAAPLLGLYAWGCRDPLEFGWFETPPVSSIDAANRLLTLLGAIEGGQITPLGELMLKLPVHPRLARLLIAATAWDVADLGVLCVALIEEKDVLASRVFTRSLPGQTRNNSGIERSSGSDLEDRLEAFETALNYRFAESLQQSGIDVSAAYRVNLVRQDLTRVVRQIQSKAVALAPECPTDDPARDALQILPLVAYPDRVCRRRSQDPLSGVMVGGRGVRLNAGCQVRTGDFFVAIRLTENRPGTPTGREANVQIATAIEANWLETLSPGSISQSRDIRFDPERGRAVAVASTHYLDLLISEQTHGAVDPEEAATALAIALLPRAEEILRSDPEASSLINRVMYIRQHDMKFPEITPEILGDLLKEACSGRATLREVQGQPMSPHLIRWLGHANYRSLAELAPEFLMVPSGSRIPITYEPGRPPTLAVRLQELFGWHDTPRIAGGKDPLLLQILGPNHRPVQLTSDLKSFWTTTYLQVRKDLRGRYPKHDWPEDPWTALPSSRPKRKNH